MPVSCARSIYSKFPELATDLEEHRQGLTLLKDCSSAPVVHPEAILHQPKVLSA